MTAQARRKKTFSRTPAPTTLVPLLDAPRRLQRTILDFRTLHLPRDVASALSEAFWHRIGAGPRQTILDHWARIRLFGRFNQDTQAVQGLTDLQGDILVRYVEWLNVQRTGRGTPLGKATKAATFTSLHKLLQWLVRCRPGLLGTITWPVNSFPWRNRDTRRRGAISASQLRMILKACEGDIAQLRLMREQGRQLRQSSRAARATYNDAPGALLDFIDDEFGGVLPPTPILYRTHHHLYTYLVKHGGVDVIEPYLYPNAYGLFPYYLAIVLHSAGNSQAIAALATDCLQPIPLLEDREMLVWEKPRASRVQRRSFRRSDPFEPPALVREILEWTSRLRSNVPLRQQNCLFLMKSRFGPTAATRLKFVRALRRFISAHALQPFTFSSIRPSVLTALYRSTGDLRAVKEMANHVSMSTTVGYVRGPEVAAQNGVRMAALQSAMLGHLELPANLAPSMLVNAPPIDAPTLGASVSMFGFSCKDPFSGVAPGTHRGSLCTNFLACLSCPNAVIPTDAPTLARLLHARDHLLAAAASTDPQ
jgi:Phage integrase family